MKQVIKTNHDDTELFDLIGDFRRFCHDALEIEDDEKNDKKATKAGFRPDQLRGSDGKWTFEGGHRHHTYSMGFVETNVTERDWNNLERALAMDSPEAKAMLKEYGYTREQAQEMIRKAEIEIQNIPHTKDVNMVDGEYTAERQALHDEIVEKMLANGETQETPTILMSGGLPGSGKSSVLDQSFYADRTGDYIKLDSDEIKKLLADHDGIKNLGIEAASYHEESDDVLAEITRRAVQNRYNIVFDTTMKTPEKFIRLVDLYRKNGYRIEVAYIDVSPVTAMTRAIGRFLGGGRYVSIPYIATHDHKNASTARMLKEYCDEWRFWSNEVPKGQKPILIEEK